MASITFGWFSLSSKAGVADKAIKPSAVQRFAEAAYKKAGGGPTPDLKRVYQAYLDNQEKLKVDRD